MHPFRGRLTLCFDANHPRAARRELGMSSTPHCAIAYAGLIALRAYDLFEVLAIFAHDYIPVYQEKSIKKNSAIPKKILENG